MTCAIVFIGLVYGLSTMAVPRMPDENAGPVQQRAKPTSQKAASAPKKPVADVEHPRVASNSGDAKSSKTSAVRFGMDADPMVLLNVFEFSGLTDTVDWKKSSWDGLWTATARVQIGHNEVSCLLESNRVDVVQRVTIEAEVYVEDATLRPLVMQFAKSLPVVLRGIPEGLADAIAQQRSWENEKWRFLKDPHPSGRGYDLRFQSK